MNSRGMAQAPHSPVPSARMCPVARGGQEARTKAAQEKTSEPQCLLAFLGTSANTAEKCTSPAHSRAPGPGYRAGSSPFPPTCFSQQHKDKDV